MIYTLQHCYKRVIQEAPQKPQTHNSKISSIEMEFSKICSLTCSRRVQGIHLPSSHQSQVRTFTSRREGLWPLAIKTKKEKKEEEEIK